MKINVIVLTYNHEKYIDQCLESVLKQKGDFQIEVIVGDDCSMDNTRNIIEAFCAKYPMVISVLPMRENLGVTKNLKRCLDVCAGEYIAICEGDDYWTDEYKLQKQMNFLEAHQDFSMCFSAFMIYHEDRSVFEPFQNQLRLTKDVLSTEDLILSNSIGNFSCCMYRTKAIKQFSDELFELFTVDWMFNMTCGQFGKIGFIRDWMSVYRKHALGVWAGQSKFAQVTELRRLIDEYNRFFDYEYNTYFFKYKEVLDSYLVDMQVFDDTERFVGPEYIDDMLQPRMRALQIAMAEAQQKIQALSEQVEERGQVVRTLLEQINAIHQSTSWKITQPVREIKSLTGKMLVSARSTVWRIGVFIFRRLPISPKKVQSLKVIFLHRLGFIFKFNPAYSSLLTTKMSTMDTKKIIEQNALSKNIVVPENPEVVKVSVVVISYNQEQYIVQCLESVFAQRGNFTVELVIGDDCSSDKTLEIIKKYVEDHSDNGIQVKILTAYENEGMTKNLQRCLYSCTGEYIAVCEGDDYWVDGNKLQKQVNFLRLHPECALCFHDVYIYYQEDDEFSLFELQRKLKADIIKTRDLVLDYYIGNLSCCMYNAKYMPKIPVGLFDLYIGDWMFNVYYSRFGDVGHLKDVMSVYRKHSQGVWSGGPSFDKSKMLYKYINEYNRFLNYEYDREFTGYQKRLMMEFPVEFNADLLDLVVIDDVFPHPLSAFRMQEFECYLEKFENLKIYSSGTSVYVLGEKSPSELLIDFKRSHPKYSEKIEILTPDTIINAKLIYSVFLGNTFASMDLIEELKIPFVFTLYPGAMFGLNNARSDMMLSRVTSSPCFRKVIVSQKIVYDYLIEKEFCSSGQVELIFGVVTPIDQKEVGYNDKMHFGITKNTLDICFVAHKYTEKGIDKGYDVFVGVAKDLHKKHDNIRFHVVGGFDENTIDIREIGGSIAFYGNRDIKWFDEFYKDKDIILSPNVPFMIFEGSFDGFPTGTCVDAGLRETVIFCTDELKLNDGFFIDGEEIVVVPHNVDGIVDLIEFYFRNPDKLAAIAKKGQEKIKKLYSYEAQILPRINILQEQIELFERNKEAIREKITSKRFFRRHFPKVVPGVLAKVRRVTPLWLKDGLKRNLPVFVRRLYEKLSV